jgi:ABC-2 type transport system ATP-binding protein
MAPILRAEGVNVSYGARTILAEVSMELHAGEVCALAGPNGSGKSTLLRAICGLIPLSAGRIEICGSDLRKQRSSALSKTGYVAQRFGLYSDLTVVENLRFYAGCYGFSREIMLQHVENTLDRLQLQPLRARLVSTLSYGWSQRLALAVATCHQPALLLLDETTSGLDDVARIEFWNILEAEAARGTTILLATHNREDIERCTRRGIIEDRMLQGVA